MRFGMTEPVSQNRPTSVKISLVWNKLEHQFMQKQSPSWCRPQPLSVSSWAPTIKLQRRANKLRSIAHESKAKLSRCQSESAHRVGLSPSCAAERDSPGLRGIELSRGYLQLLALSPWLRATDQPGRVWLQPIGHQGQSKPGRDVNKNTVAVQNTKPTVIKWDVPVFPAIVN